MSKLDDRIKALESIFAEDDPDNSPVIYIGIRGSERLELAVVPGCIHPFRSGLQIQQGDGESNEDFLKRVNNFHI